MKHLLIAGAGPVGLTAAYFAANVPNLQVTVIDKQESKGDKVFSKALNVNCRTMEIFHKTPIQQKIESDSLKVRQMRIYNRNEMIVRNEIGIALRGKTRYPFLHMYSQTLTERLIEQETAKLGISVVRNQEIIEAKNQDDKVVTQIKDLKSGELIQGQYDYVLSTEGAHSNIRKQLGLAFDGETLDHKLYLCDIEIKEGNFPTTASQVYLDGGLMAILIPLSHKTARILGNSPAFYQVFQKKYDIVKKTWESEYTINNRVIEKMSEGNIYFAGDSAHVHAPIGGRGMNMGIQDAYIFINLLRQGRLGEYNDLRKPVVDRFVKQVSTVSKIVLPTQHTWMKWLVPYVLPYAAKVEGHRMALFVGGLDYAIPFLPKL